MLAKALPKLYGDKLTTEVTGRDGAPIEQPVNLRELAREVAFIFHSGMQEHEDKAIPGIPRRDMEQRKSTTRHCKDFRAMRPAVRARGGALDLPLVVVGYFFVSLPPNLQ